MKCVSTELQDVKILEPRIFADSRGSFFESFNRREIEKHIGPFEVLQDNCTKTQAGALRGLHFQAASSAQAKLLSVLRGRIFDVVVDLRRSSPTFGQWEGFELTPESERQLFVPKGCAHGFLSLEDDTIVNYKVDAYYAPELGRGIRYDDPTLAIKWPLMDRFKDGPVLSVIDQRLPSLSDVEVFT